jgi:putrescine aminotransferase
MTPPSANLVRTTQEWQDLDRAHHVHSFTDPGVLQRQGTRVIVSAEGSYVRDSDGNQILDGMAGLWCVNVGYGRAELVEAAAQQMRRLPFYNNHFMTSTPEQIELAALIASLTPAGLDHILFASSGSEANDTVVRLVRHYWRLKGQPTKQTFISRTLAYHGSTLAGANLGGMPLMHGMASGLLPGFEHIMHPHWYAFGGDLSREEFGLVAAQALEKKILELGPENVAAFIGEPVQGAGGVYDPPSTYWPEIQRICRKYDVLLVADEVICGFGRTGHWFGSQAYGIEPDVMSMAKGLSSGYVPIAAVALNRKVFETISAGGLVAHGYTYSGHPVACAVAIANIGILQRERLVERVKESIGPYFRAKLEALAASHPLVGEVRGIGLMAALQLVSDKTSRKILDDRYKASITCRDYAANHGLIVRAVGQAMVLAPPLTISTAEVDELVEKLTAALDYTAQAIAAAA